MQFVHGGFYRAVILAERPLGTIRVVCVNGNKDDGVSGLIVELVWAGRRVIASLRGTWGVEE
jgi:hypothetical protein